MPNPSCLCGCGGCAAASCCGSTDSSWGDVGWLAGCERGRLPACFCCSCCCCVGGREVPAVQHSTAAHMVYEAEMSSASYSKVKNDMLGATGMRGPTTICVKKICVAQVPGYHPGPRLPSLQPHATFTIHLPLALAPTCRHRCR